MPQQPNAAQGFGVPQPQQQPAQVVPQQQPNAYQGFQMSPQQQPAQAQQQPAFGPPVLAQQHPNAFQGFGGIPAGNQGFFQSPAVSQPATGKDNGNQGFGGVPQQLNPHQMPTPNFSNRTQSPAAAAGNNVSQQQHPAQAQKGNERSAELQSNLDEFNHRVADGLGTLCFKLLHTASCKRGLLTVTALDQIKKCMACLGYAAVEFDRHVIQAASHDVEDIGSPGGMSLATVNKMNGLLQGVDQCNVAIDKLKATAGMFFNPNAMKDLGEHIRRTLGTVDASLAYGAMHWQIDVYGYDLLVAFLTKAKDFLRLACGLDMRTHTFELENVKKQITFVVR